MELLRKKSTLFYLTNGDFVLGQGPASPHSPLRRRNVGVKSVKQ